VANETALEIGAYTLQKRSSEGQPCGTPEDSVRFKLFAALRATYH
jgi:hypothetical protein